MGLDKDVKREPLDIKSNPSEPEDPSHSILSDPEDYLEENESLDMNLTNGAQKIWLVKLPRYLADKWSKTNDLSGKQIATVKIKKNTSGGKLQVKLVLDKKESNSDIPQEYDIAMLNTQVRNSYVFSEENLKKFKQELTEVGAMPEQPELKSIEKRGEFIPPEPEQTGRFYRIQKNDSSEKAIPFVKTIPKKTALAGKICHDCQIVPSKNDSRYSEILSKRQNITQGPARPKVTFLNEIPGVLQANAGPSIRGNNSSIFLKSNHNKRNAEGRAIRMPKKDLLDLLFRLFEEYEYWSMKGLKERTRQPESYLKESLDSIANLIKKGPYTSKYNLKPEYRRLRDAERAVRLGLDANADDNDNKDDEDDDDMEDVV
ncbi:transcription initiation factor IIF, beta subunit [Suhomyces tanzawaensis NRRL Y-17324]|uniref:Transcription initiation factor IIF subunit beta n=1 Tax=Suhomyces tanzawaensis NRRL Y-17324 TaxID=984487 RepID=A0A1E4SJJ6_9ASCO|nr:transcription initiation factor IIF, beta subunit [Suhomyces tanzawaensis NRRL Y-17324]ODV79674.1 transcription initiation factor IIF, beta subunit [Suhomyces tanzawaensis NRRL Y-17324]